MCTRRSFFVRAFLPLISVGLALVSVAKPAYASGGCIYIARWGPNLSGLQCSPTTGYLAGGVIQTLSCDTGAPTWSCNDGGAHANGIPHPYPGCYEVGETTVGPIIVDGCGQNQDDPPTCKIGGTTSDLRRGAAGLVGDPVDLRTGALSLDPVDVDLGRGLRFARHYSSKTTVLSAMGKSWAHSLDWKLFRATADTYPVVIVKEPFRPAIAFATNGIDGYVTSARNGGSVTVDGAGIVHYTSDIGVEADFDTQDRVIALRPPGDPEITVSYGTDTTTFTNGSQTLVVSVYPTGHASAGLVSSVVANGEVWSYAYNGAKYLTTVIGPDPSTPSTSDTVTWTYVYTSATTNRITRIDRSSSAGTTTIAAWTYGGGNRVVSADEPALEQALQFSYSTPQTGVLSATVSNASSQTLAVFTSDTTVTKGMAARHGKGRAIRPLSKIDDWGRSGVGSPGLGRKLRRSGSPAGNLLPRLVLDSVPEFRTLTDASATNRGRRISSVRLSSRRRLLRSGRSLL